MMNDVHAGDCRYSFAIVPVSTCHGGHDVSEVQHGSEPWNALRGCLHLSVWCWPMSLAEALALGY